MQLTWLDSSRVPYAYLSWTSFFYFAIVGRPDPIWIDIGSVGPKCQCYKIKYPSFLWWDEEVVVNGMNLDLSIDRSTLSFGWNIPVTFLKTTMIPRTMHKRWLKLLSIAVTYLKELWLPTPWQEHFALWFHLCNIVDTSYARSSLVSPGNRSLQRSLELVRSQNITEINSTYIFGYDISCGRMIQIEWFCRTHHTFHRLTKSSLPLKSVWVHHTLPFCPCFLRHRKHQWFLWISLDFSCFFLPPCLDESSLHAHSIYEVWLSNLSYFSLICSGDAV